MKPTANQCAVLTAKGRGAIATVAIRGPATQSAVNQHFAPRGRQCVDFSDRRRLFYGIWRSSEDSAAEGEGLVLCPFSTDHVEVHCHGGVAAVNSIVASLALHGFILVEPQDFNDQADCWQSETVQAIQRATTRKTATLALAQLNLAAEWWKQLKHLIELRHTDRCLQSIEDVLELQDFGRRLLEPARIVFCGEPNVGKSSLINAVLGFDRSIVHDSPGTTRDRVSHLSAIDGWPVLLQDTAGIRETEDDIERQGVSIARSTIETADVVVQVIDCSRPAADNIESERQPDLVIYNKVDLADSTCKPVERSILTSAVTGEGIPQLITAIGKLIAIDPHITNQLLPLTSKQVEWLTTLHSMIIEGQFTNALAFAPTMSSVRTRAVE